MDFQLNSQISVDSPSSSASSTVQTPSTSNHHHQNGGAPINSNDPMHSWWESISKARSRIHLLSSLLPSADDSTTDASLSALADSDRPARSLLLSPAAYFSISSSLSSPSSGSGDDPLCHWLYDTFLSSDTDLRLVVLSFIPLLSSIYLSRIYSSISTSLSGFEAVLLSLYAAETKSRGGKPILISIPDLSQPSLYHSPRNPTSAKSYSRSSNAQNRPLVGVLSPPLEHQIAVKSTKRACIVGVALDCYYKQISHMPSWSKLDFCKFSADWAGQDCPCVLEFDETDANSESSVEIGNGDLEAVSEAMENLGIENGYDELRPKGARIPLPWELLQPVIRILGHCLLGPLNAEDVKDAASVAVKRMYARASHELNPQAILATRSLIQLDKRGRETAKIAAAATVMSNANTPSKAKKPEILLVSK
ncbi:uncharacterized protein LOC129876178 [Solanum dulcamara]|uniref:uncharacterized protein LOC129876178 n=1 Tax=Solanum dulcamara TaxID=45834 RepID=UPI002485306E|nr:uncharacterized protein LOC129876178 [Solanum dulcamara]